jgi:phage baseplate assembly protein W
MYGQRVSRSFKDISLSFDPHPVTKDLPVLRNERAISRSVRNLVQTIPGEKFFKPLIGSGVRGLLFDFMDVATADSIEDEIITVINNYEPRVNNVQVRVDPRPDRNNFDVTIFFDIIGQSLPSQQFTFILEATR